MEYAFKIASIPAKAVEADAARGAIRQKCAIIQSNIDEATTELKYILDNM